MKKLDATVRKETEYIALFVLLFSAVLEAVFLIMGKWDYTVLLGNLLGGGAGIINFLLLGITLQNAVKKEGDARRALIKLSQTYRFLFLIGMAVLGMALPVFHNVTTLISLFFPRLAIALRPLMNKTK